MTDPKPFRNIARDPLNLLAAAFLLVWGTVALACRPIGDFGVETDFYGDFARYSLEWAQGRPTLMNGFRGPLYYLVLAAAHWLHLDLFTTAKLISVLSTAAALRIAGGMLRGIFGDLPALAASIVIAASPVAVEYSYRACNDLFYLLLFTGALALLFRREEPAIRDWVMAGLLTSGAYLTRYNGLFLVPAAIVAGLIRFGPSRSALAAMAAYVLAFVIPALPWWMFVQGRTGDPLWNNAYQNVAIAILARNPNLAQSGNFMSSTGLQSVRDVWDVSPMLFIQGMIRNIGEHAWRDVRELAGPVWAGTALIGLILNARAWLRRDGLAFAAIGVITGVSLLPVFYNPRFMLTLILWWGAAAGGIAAFLARNRPSKSGEGSRQKARGERKKAGPTGSPAVVTTPAGGVIAVMLVVAAVFTWRGVNFSRDETAEHPMPTEILDLVRQLKGKHLPIGENTPISARKPHIGYYLNAPVIPIVLGSTADMRAAGVHYLLVSGIESAIYPSLRPLLVPRSAADIGTGLTLVASGRTIQPNGRERRATLYALDNPIPWTPPVSSPVQEEDPVPPGLSRIDYLRLRIARWYFRWDAGIRPGALLRLMARDALDHPEVLPLRADVAMQDRNYDDAETLYRRILERKPGDERSLFCLAGIALLRNDDGKFESLILDAARGRTESGETDERYYYKRAADYIRDMDYLPALAPVSLLLTETPDSKWGLMAKAYVLQALHRFDESFATLTEYLKHYPNDTEAIGLIEALRKERKVSG